MTKHQFTTAAISLLCLTNTAQASADQVVTSASVRLNGYELTTVDGRTSVLDRIERTANRICQPANLGEQMTLRQCRADVAGSMVAQIKDPLLFAEWKRGGAIKTASRN